MVVKPDMFYHSLLVKWRLPLEEALRRNHIEYEVPEWPMTEVDVTAVFVQGSLAMLRSERGPSLRFFGEAGAEQLECLEGADGVKFFFEGDCPGQERLWAMEKVLQEVVCL